MISLPLHQSNKYIDHHIDDDIYEIDDEFVIDFFKYISQVKKHAMKYVIKNQKIDVTKNVSSIDGVDFNDKLLMAPMNSSTFDIVVYI